MLPGRVAAQAETVIRVRVPDLDGAGFAVRACIKAGRSGAFNCFLMGSAEKARVSSQLHLLWVELDVVVPPDMVHALISELGRGDSC